MVTTKTLTDGMVREHLAWLQAGQYKLGEGPRAGLDKRAAVNDCIVVLRAPPHWSHARRRHVSTLSVVHGCRASGQAQARQQGDAVKTRPLAEYDSLIQMRAVRLARLHVAGRSPIPDAAKRHRNVRDRDRAMDLLIQAVEEQDRARLAFEETLAKYSRRAEAGRKAWETRRQRAIREDERKRAREA